MQKFIWLEKAEVTIVKTKANNQFSMLKLRQKTTTLFYSVIE